MNEFDDGELSLEQLDNVTAGTAPREQVLKEEIDGLVRDSSRPGLTDQERDYYREQLEIKKQELEELMTNVFGKAM